MTPLDERDLERLGEASLDDEDEVPVWGPNVPGQGGFEGDEGEAPPVRRRGRPKGQHASQRDSKPESMPTGRAALIRQRAAAARQASAPPARSEARAAALLSWYAEEVVQVLVAMGAPGCQWLDLAPVGA